MGVQEQKEEVMSVFGKLLRGLGFGLGRGRASRKLRGIDTPKASLKSTYGAKTPRTPKTKTTVPAVSVTYDPQLLPMNLMADDIPIARLGSSATGNRMPPESGNKWFKGKPSRETTYADYVDENVKDWLNQAKVPYPVHPRTWEVFAGEAHDQAVSLRHFFNESAKITGKVAPSRAVRMDITRKLADSHGKLLRPTSEELKYMRPMAGEKRDQIRIIANPFEDMEYILLRALEKQKRPIYRPAAQAEIAEVPAPSAIKHTAEFRRGMAKHGGDPSEVTLIQFGKPVKKTTKPLQLSERLRSFKKQKAKTRAKKIAKYGLAGAVVYGSTPWGRGKK